MDRMLLALEVVDLKFQQRMEIQSPLATAQFHRVRLVAVFRVLASTVERVAGWRRSALSNKRSRLDIPWLAAGEK